MTTVVLIGRIRMWRFSAKTRKKGGRRGLCSWPLRCLSQFLSEIKERLLRGRMCCLFLRMSMRLRMRTFHRWGSPVFIVGVSIGLGFVSIGRDFSVIRIGFGSGFRKNSLLGIIFLPYWRGSSWRCSVIIFLSLLMRFGWIGRIICC